MDENMNVQCLPVLALRGLVIYPEQTVHFEVGREKSSAALDAAMARDQVLFLTPQKDVSVDDPLVKDLSAVGTIVKVKQILKAKGEVTRVLVTGLARARLTELTQRSPYLVGTIAPFTETGERNTLMEKALRREANNIYNAYLEVTEHPAQAVKLLMMAAERCGQVADLIGQNSGIEYGSKVKLLCQSNPVRRLEMAITFLRQEMEMLKLENQIAEHTKANMDQAQRDYYLREQLKAIHEELGDTDEAEFSEIEERILALELDDASQSKLLKDVERLKNQPYGSSETTVLRGYLETVLNLPWHTGTKERLDVDYARKILDRDHFGLEKVKKRILETIAVRQMAPELPPQIICLVGPPGVGKTSIAYSIAHALNRKMARIALGGVHDEADIRGHRKTYVGAMPGRIIAGITQAGSCNPLLLLDEVDKMGADYRGDPSAALLEVLDGEQNKTFRDHYLEIPFDLSDVLFITTANTLDTVPRPLLDRMEIIELGSYTDEEKLAIARDHLLPKQMKKHGLKKSQLRVTDDALRTIISGYTRESGVRSLEREIAALCRKTDMNLLENPDSKKITVKSENVETMLGTRKFLPDTIPSSDQVGLVTGLAWTSVGGETLEVEVGVMDGSGKLELTGNLGDVMKESAHAAVSYIRANAEHLGVSSDFYKTKDIHIHFPEGAVPKDGPSAGVTVCTALVSALTGRAVRRDVAMTGEVTIRGRVLPIGGLKEKTMAALRHGVRTVIIPKANQRDLEEIDQTVRASLQFVMAESVDTVLATALQPKNDSAAPMLYTAIPEEIKKPQAGIRQ